MTVRPRVGAKLGGFVVREVPEQGDPIAEAADGTEVTLALGRARALAVERSALDLLAARDDVPRVLGLGEDSGVGAFLALSRPGGEGPSPPVLESLDAALELAFAVERAGFTFTPRAQDFEAGARLCLRRLRGAMKLGKSERIDARSVVEALGAALVSCVQPMLTPPSLLRLVLPHTPRPRDLIRHPEAVRADLAAIGPDLALPGPDIRGAAYVCDVGLHRERNEDAARLEIHGEWTLMAIADGVSAATKAELASRLAVTTCIASLRQAEAIDEEAMRASIADAHHALCDEPAVEAGETLGTTLVTAAVRGRQVIVGWVGDSRAYFLGRTQAAALSRDHSWLEDALASGATTLEEALQSPWAHALTRCLGPLEGGDPDAHARPDVVVHDLPEPGALVLCTDGVWNYFPEAEQLEAIVETLGAQCTPDAIARALVGSSLLEGGRDNATVGVILIE